VHHVGFIYKITQKGHFVTFRCKDLYVCPLTDFKLGQVFVLLSELRHRCRVSDSLSLRPLPPTALSVQLLKKKVLLKVLQTQMMMVALWLRLCLFRGCFKLYYRIGGIFPVLD
jgi:hypothetical protein